MTESSDNNLVPKPNQGLVRLGKSSLMSRGRELATRQTEIEQVKGYRCVAWGDNSNGQCDVPEGERFVQVDAAYMVSAGLRPDGTALLWGGNEGPTLFAGSQICGQFPEGETFKQVACSLYNTFGLRHDGSVLAISSFVIKSSYDEDMGWEVDPVQIDHDFPIHEKFIQIACGDFHFVGLREDGTAFVWKQLDDMKYLAKVEIPEDEKFIQVACGNCFTVGLRTDGTVGCWGGYECDDEEDEEEPEPPEGNQFVSIAAGGDSSIGLKSDGTVVTSYESDWDIEEGDKFVDIGCGYTFFGLRSNGELVQFAVDGEPPEGMRFIKVVGSGSHFLGLVRD